MNIKIKKNILYFGKYRIKCAVGKRGITSKKTEGDEKTPRGTYTFKSIFYRRDRVIKLKTILKKKIIKKNMGWCDDTNSTSYNKAIKFPFNFSAERIWLKNNIYDIIIVIKYNMSPIIKKKGSAIFLHVAKKNYNYTKGCIAIKKEDLIFLASKINNKTKIIIS